MARYLNYSNPLNAARFGLGAIIGVVATFAVGIALISCDFFLVVPPPLVIVPPIVICGFTGGLASASCAPHYKGKFAAIVGGLLAAALLAFDLRHGLYRGDRNLLLWYWPIWLPPFFWLGGLVVERLSRSRQAVGGSTHA